MPVRFMNIDMNKVFMNVLNYPLDNKALNNTLSNYKFYVKSLIDFKIPNSQNIQLLSDNSFIKDYPELYSSTASPIILLWNIFPWLDFSM